MKKKLIVLFGMSGSGKNYLGESLSDHINGMFVDGDDLFTDQDIEHLKQVTFTDEMRDDYHKRLINYVDKLFIENTNIILATCLVKQRHRDLIYKHYKNSVMFVYLETKDTLSLHRLQNRQHFFPASKYYDLKRKYDPITLGFQYLSLHNKNNTTIKDLLELLKTEEAL